VSPANQTSIPRGQPGNAGQFRSPENTDADGVILNRPAPAADVCYECGGHMIVDDSGVTYHVNDDGDTDHDTDAHHVALSELDMADFTEMFPCAPPTDDELDDMARRFEAELNEESDTSSLDDAAFLYELQSRVPLGPDGQPATGTVNFAGLRIDTSIMDDESMAAWSIAEEDGPPLYFGGAKGDAAAAWKAAFSKAADHRRRVISAAA
jgi:hypothetical protein